jgi:hypothetical protein
MGRKEFSLDTREPNPRREDAIRSMRRSPVPGDLMNSAPLLSGRVVPDRLLVAPVALRVVQASIRYKLICCLPYFTLR